MRIPFQQAVLAEVEFAVRKHGSLPWGRHEFFALLKEEVDEVWDNIKRDGPTDELLAEVVQVAAVCQRYAESPDRYRGVHPPLKVRPALGAA